MQGTIESALTGFLDRFLAAAERAHGSLPRQPYEPEWPSPCQSGEPDPDGLIAWRPVERSDPADFSGLENALEVTIHEDIKAYFGTYWCDVVAAEFPDGRLTLIQVWNAADFDRLIENIIGHAFAKQQADLPLTVFFASTDEGEHFLSVDNETGRVMLEVPGEPPIREVEASLAEFLAQLNPVVSS